MQKTKYLYLYLRLGYLYSYLYLRARYLLHHCGEVILQLELGLPHYCVIVYYKISCVARIWCEGITNRSAETETPTGVDWVENGRSWSIPLPGRLGD